MKNINDEISKFSEKMSSLIVKTTFIVIILSSVFMLLNLLLLGHSFKEAYNVFLLTIASIVLSLIWALFLLEKSPPTIFPIEHSEKAMVIAASLLVIYIMTNILFWRGFLIAISSIIVPRLIGIIIKLMLLKK